MERKIKEIASLPETVSGTVMEVEHSGCFGLMDKSEVSKLKKRACFQARFLVSLFFLTV